MKKLIYIALAAAALLAVSCGKDDSKDSDSSITGTWLMRADEYHYFDATFKKDGTYEWLWQGAGGRLLDTGTYTFSGNVVTMTAKKFQEEDYESNKMTDAEMPQDWSGVRTVTVVENKGAVAFWKWNNDYFMDNSDNFRGENMGPILVFKDGANLNIKDSELIGTWEIKEDDYIDRLVFEKGGFTQYGAWKNDEAEGGLSVTKELGTWSVKGNVLSLKYEKMFSSSKSLGWNPEKQINEYIYYKVNPETLEAEQWESYTQDFSLQWYIYIENGKLYTPSYGIYSKK